MRSNTLHAQCSKEKKNKTSTKIKPRELPHQDAHSHGTINAITTPCHHTKVHNDTPPSIPLIPSSHQATINAITTPCHHTKMHNDTPPSIPSIPSSHHATSNTITMPRATVFSHHPCNVGWCQAKMRVACYAQKPRKCTGIRRKAGQPPKKVTDRTVKASRPWTQSHPARPTGSRQRQPRHPRPLVHHRRCRMRPSRAHVRVISNYTPSVRREREVQRGKAGAAGEGRNML